MENLQFSFHCNANPFTIRFSLQVISAKSFDIPILSKVIIIFLFLSLPLHHMPSTLALNMNTKWSPTPTCKPASLSEVGFICLTTERIMTSQFLLPLLIYLAHQCSRAEVEKIVLNSTTLKKQLIGINGKMLYFRRWEVNGNVIYTLRKIITLKMIPKI